MENRSREKVSKTRKLLLTIEDVAELTGLPADFWAYVAEHESEWDIERFIHAGGSYLITRYYLDAYLIEDIGWYYRRFETDERGSVMYLTKSEKGEGGTNSLLQ